MREVSSAYCRRFTTDLARHRVEAIPKTVTVLGDVIYQGVHHSVENDD